MDEICANCEHWKPTDGKDGCLTGTCYRYPPQVLPYIQINEVPVAMGKTRFSASSDGMFVFPGTDRNKRCGEFRLRAPGVRS